MNNKNNEIVNLDMDKYPEYGQHIFNNINKVELSENIIDFIKEHKFLDPVILADFIINRVEVYQLHNSKVFKSKGLMVIDEDKNSDTTIDMWKKQYDEKHKTTYVLTNFENEYVIGIDGEKAYIPNFLRKK